MVTDIHLLSFAKLYYLTHRDDKKLHQNSSSLQLTTDACQSFHSHFSRDFHHPQPDSLFIMKLKENQNMIYVKLRKVNLPATVTNKRSNIANRLVNDLIKKYTEEKFLDFFFLVTDTKGIMCDTGMDRLR